MRRARRAVSGCSLSAATPAWLRSAILPLVFTSSRIPLLESSMPSMYVDEDCDIELCIVLLHVVGSIFVAEFLDHGRHLLCVGERNGVELTALAAGIDAHLRVLEYVLVPLRIRALHRQQVKLVFVEHKPDWV